MRIIYIVATAFLGAACSMRVSVAGFPDRAEGFRKSVVVSTERRFSRPIAGELVVTIVDGAKTWTKTIALSAETLARDTFTIPIEETQMLAAGATLQVAIRATYKTGLSGAVNETSAEGIMTVGPVATWRVEPDPICVAQSASLAGRIVLSPPPELDAMKGSLQVSAQPTGCVELHAEGPMTFTVIGKCLAAGEVQVAIVDRPNIRPNSSTVPPVRVASAVLVPVPIGENGTANAGGDYTLQMDWKEPVGSLAIEHELYSVALAKVIEQSAFPPNSTSYATVVPKGEYRWRVRASWNSCTASQDWSAWSSWRAVDLQ